MRYLLPKKAQLDKIAGEIVRSRGFCEAGDLCRSKGNGSSKHAKALTWAHIVSRRYLLTRWRLDNAFCLCMACHMYFTYHPLEWEAFVQMKIGYKYEQLKKAAMGFTKVDYGATMYALEKEKKRLKL